MTDGRWDTAWRVQGNGIGESLVLEFDRPIRVDEIQVLPGYAKLDPADGTDRFWQNRRVSRVRFEFSDGTQTTAQFIELAQLQGQRIEPSVVTTFVRIVIEDTTAPAQVDGRDYAPISEVVVIGGS